MVISHGGQSLDISAAAQGCLSSTPIGVFSPQNIPYPGTKYCFDENIFFGCEAKELLVKMLRSPNCIDGCKLVSKRPKSNSSIFRKGTWTFVCSHGIVMNEIEDSHFHPDSVGKSHVPIQRLKRTKSKGSAVKGKLSMFSVDNYAILPVIHNQFPTGTDAMATKDTQRRLIKVNKNQLKHPKVLDVRRTVSTRSPSSDLKCTMQIIIFLGQDNRFYLSTKSCLTHCHHPALKADAILRGHNDMEQGDLDLISLLVSVNATGVQMSQIMQSLKGPESGTYLPKRMYQMNQKTEQLQDLALGLIPGCSDAKKTVAKLEELVHLFTLFFTCHIFCLSQHSFIYISFLLGLRSIISMLFMKMVVYLLVLRNVRQRH